MKQILRKQRYCLRKYLYITAAITLFSSFALAQTHLGLQPSFISEQNAPGSFALSFNGRAADIVVSQDDFAGVRRAASDLQKDLVRVTNLQPRLVDKLEVGGHLPVIVGTIGKSPQIDELMRRGKLDTRAIVGKWESFIIATVPNPVRGVPEALVIAGSDRRGTIYGIYEVSQQIGVSPWYWWADVPPHRHSALFVRAGRYVQGPPAVKYRGLFINDENPALNGWAKEKFGGVNSQMYSHVFELILRLRANFLWPAMWGKAFNEDDPESPKLADEYGVVMGTSHHEPLMRAQEEWTKRHLTYGNGEWNYLTNRDGLLRFWQDGVSRNKKYENVYTIGMRGDGDMAMPDAGGQEANKRLLEGIITDQRKILAENVNPNVTKVPQIWALYTEVQKYYDAVLRPPDDVTLLFTDDNVGNLRRVPTEEERKRSGGFGIYYHMDMNGGPFSYKWLNSNPLPKIWEQMNLAYQYGATRLWIVNVGDIKPLEVPLEFFLRMAWAPENFSKDKLQDYLNFWAEREFGAEHSAEIGSIVARYAKYNASPKPELVKPNTFSLVNYREAERVEQNWKSLEAEARHIDEQLSPEQHDAFYQLVLYPVLASGNAVELEIAAARNQLFAQQGRTSTNAEADLVRELFAQDQKFSNDYNHRLAQGKWDHMMDQIHIGYTSWETPNTSNMPAVTQVALTDQEGVGVAVEGSERAASFPEGSQLPTFDSLQPKASFFEVFPTGSRLADVTVKTEQPWIVVKDAKAFSAGAQDRRYSVEIDWAKIPAGTATGEISIRGVDPALQVKVVALKATEEQEREAKGTFGGLTGPIVFDAAAASRNIAVKDVRWEKIPDYGREDSAMTIFPVTAESIVAGKDAPRLEYDLYFAHAGSYTFDLITNPTLDLYPGRKLAVAVAIDSHQPEEQAVFTPRTQQYETFDGRNFYANDRNNARILHFQQTIATPGKHTLSIAMVDPTMVIEKIIVHDVPLPRSFFGPESEPEKRSDAKR